MSRPALLAVVCLLAGCGGGGSDANACVQTARVQLFGDSTMAGYEGGRVPSALAAHTPAVLLQQAADTRFGTGRVVVTSRARDGTTAKQLADGADGLNQPWPLSVDADVIVINHGINDMQAKESQADYRALLERFAGNTAGAALVFETPNRVKQLDVAPYAETMRQVAKVRGIALADTYAISTTAMLGDWAHPTDAGYTQIVAQSLAPAVLPVVAQKLCK